MDLTAAISNLQIAKTVGSIQIAVAKKIMDVQKYSGNAANQLIEAATQGFNQAGDALAAAATGLGGSVDVQA